MLLPCSEAKVSDDVCQLYLVQRSAGASGLCELDRRRWQHGARELVGDGNVTTGPELSVPMDTHRGLAPHIQKLPLWQIDREQDGQAQAMKENG